MIIKTILLILVVGLIILSILTLIKKQRLKKAATIVRNSSETIVNSAMIYVAQNLAPWGVKFLTTEGDSVADVWGQSVVGFNYKADLSQNQTTEQLERQINRLLATYSQNHHFEDANGPLLQVSDIWIIENVLELDVVYLINPQTRAYLSDLSKL
jgi:hypothetical protein